MLTFLGAACQSQPVFETADNNNTLLWEISGNNLQSPSYFYGTMHVLCPEDAHLTKSLIKIIDQVKEIYLEIDLDDMTQLFGAIKEMAMKDEMTLKALLTEEEYDRVKNYFDERGSIPFKMIENYKPMLLAAMLQEQSLPCKATNGVELLILEESNKRKINLKGLETMGYQAGLFDSIPYAEQAAELVKAVDSVDVKNQEVTKMVEFYRNQQLDSLNILVENQEGMEAKYLDLLLYQRNRNWANSFDSIAEKTPTLFAVGAGHLPGPHGVLALLKQKGYTIRALKNE